MAESLPPNKSESAVAGLSAVEHIDCHDLESPMGWAICAMVLGATNESEAKDVVNRFCLTLQARGLRAAMIVGGALPDGAPAGVIGVESPGRLALLFLPLDEVIKYQTDFWIDVLRHARIEAVRRGMAITQALVEPEDTWRAGALEKAGFEKLATLIYMERSLGLGLPAPRGNPATPQFSTLRQAGEAAIGSVLADTYEGSLDCPALNGRRSLADILAAHRAAGEFDADLWFVAELDQQPAGVILLAPIPESSTVELVYMGVSPKFRSQGVGDALLRQACQVCKARRYSSLTLAVDEANPYALKMYERWRFKPIGRRIAWVSYHTDP